MTTNKKIIIATYLLGLIPLTVGLSIFFSWWIGRAWYLTTFERLEFFGFFWIPIAFVLGLAGLCTGLFYLSDNFKTDPKKGIIGLLCVLINIPAVIWVMDKQKDIDQRAYVRIHNHTGCDFKWMTMDNSLFIESINVLRNGDRKTGYFYPNYDEWEISFVPPREDDILTIRTDDEVKRIVMPGIPKACGVELYIDEQFRIEVRGEWDY